MCELLVRVVSKNNDDDPYLDAKCLKRGDVVTIQRDGWAWGRQELKNPHWRILSIPEMTVEQAQVFTSQEVATTLYETAMLQSRGFHIDLDHTSLALFQRALADSTRSTAIIRLPFTLAQVLALKVRKDPLIDPNVFS
jgi:hypothetical protein